MFSTTVIPTIARPVLFRAVESVLDQSFDDPGLSRVADFEVIVVNDSGRPLPEASWRESDRVRIIDNNLRERTFARNSGAAAARGQYLHFLDDDDWLLPGALQTLWELAEQNPGADWLYGSSQLVDRQGQPVIQLHHGLQGNCFVQVMAGEWIPLQSSLIRAPAFFDSGGFTSLIHGAEDVDLCRRIALRGDLAGVEALVACIGMGSEGSTTNILRSQQYSRWAREKILDEPGVFSRLRASADASHWRGRVVRIYLTSLLWNLRRRRLFTALGRGVYGLAGLALAGRHLASPDFWRGLSRRYVSPTFLKGFEAAARGMDRDSLQ